MELRVGNKYRLGRKIGSGSFGDIYLGKFTLFIMKCAKQTSRLLRIDILICLLFICQNFLNHVTNFCSVFYSNKLNICRLSSLDT